MHYDTATLPQSRGFQPPTPIFAWICHTSLSAAVLIALVLAVQFAFGKYLSPRWRYALGLLILLRFLLPFAPASSLSIFNLASHPAKPPPPATLIAAQPPVLHLPAVSPAPSVTTLAYPAPVLLSITSVAHAAISTPPARITIRDLAPWLWLAGFAAMLLTVAVQYQLFVRKLGRWERVTEPRVLELLQGCRTTLGLRRPVILLAATGLDTPALFGLLRPRLLIPAEMLRRLDDRELRHILLHELTHLQRGDLLVNWTLILVRAAHWFNPLVWLAFRRLRADQELACDAAVIARLAHDERRSYGHTLLKLLDQFSSHGLCPGLVPFVTNKLIIKRRIVMISNFKPAGRLAACASLALLLALGVFTFTRAAEQKPAAAQLPGQLSIVVINDDGSLHLVMKDAPAITLNQLKEQLKEDKSKDPNLRLELDVAKKANYEVVKEVLRIADELRVKEVGFGIENTPSTAPGSRQASINNVALLKEATLSQELSQAEQRVTALRAQLASITNSTDEPIGNPEAAAAISRLKDELQKQEFFMQRQGDPLQKPGSVPQSASGRVPTREEYERLVTLSEKAEADYNSALQKYSSDSPLLEDAKNAAEHYKAQIEQLNIMYPGVAAPDRAKQPKPVAILDDAAHAQIPADVRDEYERDFALLERTTDDYNVALVKYPAGSALLKDSKNLVDHYKARIDQLEKQYPDLVAATRPDMARAQNIQNLDRTISVLQSKLREQNDRKLADVSDGADPTPYIAHVNETIAETQTQLVKNQALLDHLSGLGQEDLRQVLSTTVPDSILTQLLQDQLSAESKLAQLNTTSGSQSPDVLAAKELIHKLDQQLDDRVKGIITGLKAQVDVEETTIKSLKNELQKRSQEQADFSNADTGAAALEKQLADLRKQRQRLSSSVQAQLDPWGNAYTVNPYTSKPNVANAPPK